MDALASSFISRHIRVRISTRRPVEFIDITDRVEGVVREHAVRAGLLNVQSLHTTAALVVNEHEPLLLEDFAAMLGRLVPIEAPYRHDAALAPVEDPASEASRANGHAHCRSLVLSSAVCLNVVSGRLHLGRWQRVFLVELDGPRERELSVLVLGEDGR
jgi:secondary thiamine-phosphate synthase enzyme